MKIVAIGDPHGNIDKIKEIPLTGADLILVTGDLGKSDKLREFSFANTNRIKKGLAPKEYTANQYQEVYMEIYNSAIRIIKYLSRFAPVYVIFGNIARDDKYTLQRCKEFNVNLPLFVRDIGNIGNVKILRDKIIEINGIKIGGLDYFMEIDWAKEFVPNDDKRMELAIKETENVTRILSQFGKIDILLCHQPPYGVLDKVNFIDAPPNWQGKHAGSKLILKYIEEKQPKFVVCGHIHESAGNARIGKTQVFNLGLANYKIIEL